MSPSLEVIDKVAQDLPVKPLATKVNGVPGVAAMELQDADKHDLVLKHFRAFIADLCEQFKGGHPG
jgi:dihydroxyacetone synthase